MSAFIAKILETQFINHHVKRFAVEKPPGFTFIPGQATEIAINLPEWKEQFRPFTFTGLNRWDYLEFLIKIYPERKGVTAMLGRLQAGAELILNNPFGAIEYKGPGVFIAGGSGITPFVAIFRDLFQKGELRNCRLIYSTRTADEIILHDELKKMLNDYYFNLITREQVVGFMSKRIDRNYLIEHVVDFSQHFYVCGPEDFVKQVSALLLDLGANADSLIAEW